MAAYHTAKMKQRITHRLKEGKLTTKQIARELGIGMSSVKHIKRGLGLTSRNLNSKENDERRILELKQRYRRLQESEIIKKYQDTVRKIKVEEQRLLATKLVSSNATNLTRKTSTKKRKPATVFNAESERIIEILSDFHLQRIALLELLDEKTREELLENERKLIPDENYKGFVVKTTMTLFRQNALDFTKRALTLSGVNLTRRNPVKLIRLVNNKVTQFTILAFLFASYGKREGNFTKRRIRIRSEIGSLIESTFNPRVAEKFSKLFDQYCNFIVVLFKEYPIFHYKH